MKSVRCIELCKTYRQGEVEVTGLDHVNLEIEEGGFVCLSAPSGGGKTTLLNAIGGLDTPDSGEIWLAGGRIDDLGKGELARMRLHQIGFVFQAYNLIPVLTARENIEFVMEVQGVPAGERRARSLELLEEVGLGGLDDRRPAQMSGGQQQRVAVARAIASRPALVLADEPTANLDSHTGAEIITLMRKVQEEHEVSFVFSTHDPQLISHADDIFAIRDGELVEHRTEDRP
jgi:putative ABC transport system ATP-binding protein